MNAVSGPVLGEPAWEGPATWGQQALHDGLHRYQRQRWCRNTVSVRPVAAGSTVAETLAGIARQVSEREALRTEFGVAAGGLRQRVHPPDELAVDICEAGGHGAELVGELAAELPSRRLDLPGRLPVSFTVVTERSAPRWVVTALCFQNADGPSVRVLLDDPAAGPAFGQLDGRAGTAARQPREQHAVELGDAARRRSDRAIAHWLAECAKAEFPPWPRRAGAAPATLAHEPVADLAVAPTTAAPTTGATTTAANTTTANTGVANTAVARVAPDPAPAAGPATAPGPHVPGEPAAVAQGVLTSAAAAARAQSVARRAGVPSSGVLLTAVAVAVAAATGRRSVALQPFVSNRHLPGVGGYVGFLAQLCALTAELDRRATFADTAAQLQRAALRSYRNAWWSPADLDAALLAAGLRPPDVLGAACTVNDLRGAWPGAAPTPPDPGRDFAIRPLPWWPYQGGRCAVAFTGGPELLGVALRLDTAYLPAELLPRLLMAVDGVLRAADRDPAVPVAELLAHDPHPAPTISLRAELAVG